MILENYKKNRKCLILIKFDNKIITFVVVYIFFDLHFFKSKCRPESIEDSSYLESTSSPNREEVIGDVNVIVLEWLSTIYK